MNIVAVLALSKILTLNDALSTAQRNQPLLLQAHANTAAADARVIENRAPLLPQVSASAVYQRGTGNSAPSPGLGVNVPTKNSLATFNTWNLGMALNQQVYDFGVSIERFRSSKALAGGQEATEKATVLTIESQVRTGFFTARAQKDLVKVAQETLDNQKKHLVQTEGFVSVGTQPEIALAQAKTGVANAVVQLISAQNNYETAKAQLNMYMGVESSTDYDVADDSLPVIDGEDESTDALMVEALKTRPELASLVLQVRAQELALRGAKGAYGPAITVGTGVTGRGTDITDLGWNWQANVSLSWSIFSGLSTYGTVKEADANKTALEAQLSGEKLQVRLDVEQARLAVRSAKVALTAAGEAEFNAREQLRLAEGRYQAGVGSIIELGDAQVAMTTAAAQRVQADYGLSSARAQLLHALGRR